MNPEELGAWMRKYHVAMVELNADGNLTKVVMGPAPVEAKPADERPFTPEEARRMTERKWSRRVAIDEGGHGA